MDAILNLLVNTRHAIEAQGSLVLKSCNCSLGSMRTQDFEQTVLTEVGYSVEVAENGEQALALLNQQKFDLVLSDVIMPVMDGYRLVEILAEQCPAQNIKLVSGYEESGESDRTADLVVLRKPFDAFELVQAVNRAVA